MQSLEDFKRERLEEFKRKGLDVKSNGYATTTFILETIDLLDQRTKEVVEEAIGVDHPELGKIDVVAPAINAVKHRQRQRAKTLLGGIDE